MPHASENVIKTRLYLRRAACNFTINKQHLILEMIDKLHVFREQDATLTKNKMDLLWEIIQLDPNHEIHNSDVTPDLIRHLEVHQKQHINITKTVITRLIQHETTRRQQASIANVFLTLCDTLPTDEQTLLNDLELGFPAATNLTH